MKKILFSALMLTLLGSCGESREVSDAKAELLSSDDVIAETSSGDETSDEEDDTGDTASNSHDPVEIRSLESDPALEFDDIMATTLLDGEVKISGNTTRKVEKIIVEFSNPTSSYPNDSYELQKFSAGDASFEYFASSRTQTLDYGENRYTFTAYNGDDMSVSQVILRVPEKQFDEREDGDDERNLIGSEDNTILIDLPVNTAYGEPIRFGETSFSYTQVKGFEAEKKLLPEVSCSNLTEYLAETINTWFYWNTCREMSGDKGLWFNVIRIEWEEYVYERHYLDFVHGIEATYELQRGTGVTQENIEEKNTELKDITFPNEAIADKLMADIIDA